MDDFELIECIDDGLMMFGPSIRYTVYWRMIILHDVPREGILQKPEAFVKCLEGLFGAGAQRIESTIASKIKERFHLELESESLPEVIHYATKQIAVLANSA